MNDNIPMTTFGVQMPEELKRNLKAELAREGKDLTEFVVEKATKYLKKKKIKTSQRAKKTA